MKLIKDNDAFNNHEENYSMKEIKVMLTGVERIAEFVNIMERLSVNADLGQGSIRIDARSMMGVMAMDTMSPITLSIY